MPKNNLSQEILECLDVGVFAFDAKAKIVFANAHASQFLGWEKSSLVGEPLSVIAKDQPISLSKMGSSHGAFFFRKDKSSFPVEYVSNPILTKNKVLGTAVAFFDMTERKALENQREEFVGNLSHELRSPLTIIKGAVWNLKDGVMGALTEKQAKLVETTSRHIDRLSRLVEDVLEISRLQSGKAIINRRRLNLVSLLEETLYDYQVLAKEKYISIKTKIAHDLPFIYADADMIEQVLHNLLNNSLRFAKEKIMITATLAEEGWVQVGVLDDGSGIAKEDQSKLFNKFEQLQRSTGVSGYKGTGLGLSICKEIVGQHQGKIWVDSETGRGAQFYFTLPEYDPKTDFRFALRSAMEEANRNRTSLALAVLSIDHVNGTGENVLHKLEENIRKMTLRQKDRLFRYTRKDFIFLLPHTPQEGAIIIASRIEQFAKDNLKKLLGSGKLPTLNMGIVVYPNDATSLDRLVEVAFEKANQKKGKL